MGLELYSKGVALWTDGYALAGSRSSSQGLALRLMPSQSWFVVLYVRCVRVGDA